MTGLIIIFIYLGRMNKQGTGCCSVMDSVHKDYSKVPIYF